jgi:hypothetical protein
MNRSKKRMVCVDFDRSILPKDTDITIFIPEFEGQGDDKYLLEALPLLIKLANPKIKDVREELAKYGEDPVSKFNEEVDAMIKAKESRLGMGQAKGSRTRNMFNPMGVQK